jgi:methylated-DNA-protein-cysteine methyltransferase related protein
MRRKKKPSSRSVNPLRHKGAAGSRVTETPSPIYAHIRAAIRQIPRGKVSTYGAVARAAGFPGAARQVARALHSSVGLPWQRVLGSGGQIKLRGDSAMEQRFRLEAEGVRFRGKKVDMKAHEFRFAKKRSK